MLQTLPREFQIHAPGKEARDWQPRPEKALEPFTATHGLKYPPSSWALLLKYLFIARHSKRWHIFLIEMIKMMSKRNFAIYLALYYNYVF